MGQTERLQALASQVVGLKLDDPEAKQVLDRADWANHWPIVTLEDGELVYTGEVVETEEAISYANVADDAMIALDELTPVQRREAESEGYYVPAA